MLARALGVGVGRRHKEKHAKKMKTFVEEKKKKGEHVDHEAFAHELKTEFSSTPVWDAVKRTFRFHLGTIALGAALIAIINFIRIVVKYIEHQSKNKGRLQRVFFCLAQWCVAPAVAAAAAVLLCRCCSATPAPAPP